VIETVIDELQPKLKCEFYNLRSILNIRVSNYYEGLQFLKKGIKLAKEHNFNELEAKMLVNLSAGFARIYKYKQAAKCALESLKYDFPILNSKAYYNLYLINDYLGQQDKLLDYVSKSKELADQSQDVTCYADSLSALISVYSAQGNIDLALKHAIEHEEFCRKHQLETEVCYNKLHLAEFYLKKNQAEKALEEVELGIALSIKHGLLREEIGFYDIALDVAFSMRDYELAKVYLDNFFKLKKANATEGWHTSILKKNIIVQEKLNDEVALLDAYEKYYSFIEKHYVGKNFEDSDSEFLDFAEKEVEEVRKINEEIASKNEELKTISYMLAHDLRTPIRNIGSFVALLEKEMGSSGEESIRGHLDFLKISSSELYKKLDIAESFLNYRLPIKRMHVNVERVILDVFENLDNNESTLKTNGKSQLIYSNHSLIFDLFQNMFECILALNTSVQTDIKVNFIDSEQIVISESGNGLYEASLIYERALRSPIKDQKKNIYFAFTEKLIDLHCGKFSFIRNDKEETSLSISLLDLSETKV